MYAIIRTGGKQHRVTKGERLKIEKLDVALGDEVTFDDVLLIAGVDQPKIGQPLVEGAKVTAKAVYSGKHKKLRVFKRKRRKGFHKTIGHRQPFTEVEITGIAG